jgi:HSP20 family protein
MNMRDLIPWGRSQTPTNYRPEESSPFLTLHREMNRLFDDVFRGFDVAPLGGRMAWPNVEAVDTGKEIRISAELPGMDEKDVEVLMQDGVLTVRGEKKAETEDKDRHFSERYYGRFERSIALPYEVEEDKAEASFRNGVLTVTLPKSEKAQDKAKRIAINAGSDTKH